MERLNIMSTEADNPTHAHIDVLDKPRGTVRPGEELDLERLEAYLKREITGLDGPLTVDQFGKGFSNLTYLIRVGERELVLRRPPFGAKIKSAHDMGREYRILSHLIAVYPTLPRVLAYCEDEAVLGAPFYVMERVQGVILRSKPPEGLALGHAQMRSLSEAFVDTMVAIHGADYTAAGLGDLGRPGGYIERQVTGWTGRYEKSKTDDIPEVERAAAWLAAHRPPESGASLIHNDYKYDNLVLDPANLSHIRAVLDWEMATLGDPLMDLGTSLAYWIEPADGDVLQALELGLTTLPGNLTRTEVVQRYARVSGRDVTEAQMVYFYVFGLFKNAVVAQQIYARWKAGSTKDERFGLLIYAIKALGERAVAALERNRLN